MSHSTEDFPHGTLLESIRARTSAALASGKLLPIETKEHLVEDDGIAFMVKQATNLLRKEADRSSQSLSPNGKKTNPFLPYDVDLCVSGVSTTHVALLNKFNVLENHLLVVTRAFEEQESELKPGDFQALCRCMAEYPSLGFYNSGKVAGASQGHKHLQVVSIPLSRSRRCAPVPIESLLFARIDGEGHGPPFRHAVRRWDFPDQGKWEVWAEHAWADYRGMLDELGMHSTRNGLVATPYNLLMTRDWMLIVPRSQECFDGISVNALGFAGSFFVKGGSEIERLTEAGPLSVLRATGQAEPQP